MKNKVIYCIAIGLATVTARGYAQKITQDAVIRSTDTLAMPKFIKVDKPDKDKDKVKMSEPSLPMALAIDLSFIAGLAFMLHRRASAHRRTLANCDTPHQTE